MSEWKEEFDRDAKLHDMYFDHLKHEDTLNGQRIGWLVTIQPLFLVAYGVLLNPQLQRVTPGPPWLRILLSLFALVICTTFAISFMGGVSIIKRYEQTYDIAERQFGSSSQSGFPDLREVGNKAVFLPYGYAIFASTFAGLWAVLCLTEIFSDT